MTDKDVERNVRSTVPEGVATPHEKHDHAVGKDNVKPLEKKMEAKRSKSRLIEKFRQREQQKRAGREKS